MEILKYRTRLVNRDAMFCNIYPPEHLGFTSTSQFLYHFLEQSFSDWWVATQRGNWKKAIPQVVGEEGKRNDFNFN